MSKLKITFAALTVVAAIASSRYLIAQPAQVPSASPAPAISAPELAGLQAENQQLKTEIAQLKAAAAAAAPSPLADLHVLVSAAEQRLIRPMGVMLLQTTDGKLAPGVASIFKLTPGEKAALENSLATARQRIDGLAAATVAAVERPAETSVVFRISPFPEEGGKVRDQLVADFKNTLGEERFTALVTITGNAFERQFGNGFGGFGAVIRTVTINRQMGGPFPGTGYVVTDQTQAVPGNPGGQMGSTLMTYDRAGLEQNFPALVKLLPAEF